MDDAVAFVGGICRRCSPEEVLRVGCKPVVGKLEGGNGWPPIVCGTTPRVELGVAADPLANNVRVMLDGGAVTPPGKAVSVPVIGAYLCPS